MIEIFENKRDRNYILREAAIALNFSGRIKEKAAKYDFCGLNIFFILLLT